MAPRTKSGGSGAIADEVAGEQDQVGREGVDLGEDAAQERGLRVLVEVDVADLGDAEVVEGVRADCAMAMVRREDADLVAGNLAGIERQACGSGRGTEQEGAAGESGFSLCQRLIGHISGHSP